MVYRARTWRGRDGARVHTQLFAAGHGGGHTITASAAQAGCIAAARRIRRNAVWRGSVTRARYVRCDRHRIVAAVPEGWLVTVSVACSEGWSGGGAKRGQLLCASVVVVVGSFQQHADGRLKHVQRISELVTHCEYDTQQPSRCRYGSWHSALLCCDTSSSGVWGPHTDINVANEKQDKVDSGRHKVCVQGAYTAIRATKTPCRRN